MRCLAIAFASAAALAPAAYAREDFVAAFRVAETNAETEAVAIRDGADIYLPRAAAEALGIAATADEIRLQDIASVTEDAQSGRITIHCTAACFPARASIEAAPHEPPVIASADPGVFLNADLNASAIGGVKDFSAAFEVVRFAGLSNLTHTWIAGDRGVRLDTRWTHDDPAGRTRLILGDSLARAGAGAAPVRFGGVSFGRAFDIDPSYVTFPTLDLTGAATAPAVVDVYVDGVLRARRNIDAGPFAIPDAPLITGAGQARIVVTDVLGRQTSITQPFYASPALLRPGLTDFAFATGALRENYARASSDYGDAFALGVYRRGIAPWLTLEARAEASSERRGAGAALSFVPWRIGQVDLAADISQSEGGEDGSAASIAFTRSGGPLALSASYTAASDDFARVGPEPRGVRAAQVSAGWSDPRLGAASLAVTWNGVSDARTYALAYTPRISRLVDLTFALRVAQTDSGSDAAFTLTLSAPDEAGGIRALWMDAAEAGVTIRAQAQRGATPAGLLGYRAGVAFGVAERADLGVEAQTHMGEARIEASYAGGLGGLRGRLAFGVTNLGGRLTVARPFRSAFAIVDAGAPDVPIYHDGRMMGRTDRLGRLILPELRAYDVNRITLDLDDLPASALVASDTTTVRPPARAGVLVRLALRTGASGETRVRDSAGNDLPRGDVLTRQSDGARFPVGAGGRIFLADLTGVTRLERTGTAPCAVTVAPETLDTDQICAPY